MKIKIHHDGKTHEAAGYWGDVITAAHDAVEHDDAIETASLTAEIDGEKVELVLPKDVVMGVLEGLGIAGDAPAPEEEAPPVEEPAPEEEEIPVDAVEIDEEDEKDKVPPAPPATPPAPSRMDAAEVEKIVDARVKVAIAAERLQSKKDAAERAEVERIAAPLLSDGYDFSDGDVWQV
jgi:hypothetical protein